MGIRAMTLRKHSHSRPNATATDAATLLVRIANVIGGAIVALIFVSPSILPPPSEPKDQREFVCADISAFGSIADASNTLGKLVPKRSAVSASRVA